MIMEWNWLVAARISKHTSNDSLFLQKVQMIQFQINI